MHSTEYDGPHGRAVTWPARWSGPTALGTLATSLPVGLAVAAGT